ncbi:MAG: endonuclease/exonuclease/phosphatase family protein [Planctomycetaceae bacterium]|nr:endonuclease/exonuclease/phosphatase family protein [Planctomycetaceae bacterium]
MKTPILRVATWNVEWATPASRRGKVLQKVLKELAADVLCITESCTTILPALGDVITSTADYGYAAPKVRRKVLLWSRTPWFDIDVVGHNDLPAGRFAAGSTFTPLGQIRVTGVCVPWRGAHVSTGRRDREPWQEHMQYLQFLSSALAPSDTGTAIWLGDFNQRLPTRGVPSRVQGALQAALQSWQVATVGNVSPVGENMIDHVAHSADLRPVRVVGQPRVAEDGMHLSDHCGVTVDFCRT